ncbi:MAG: hypothetical protein WC839_01315 [Candidatus Paceibacterota bacterium]
MDMSEKIKIFLLPLVKEIPNSKTIYVDIFYFFSSLIFGILEYWTFPAAISVFFIQLLLFFSITNIFMIKFKYSFFVIFLFNIWTIIFLGIHAFVLRKYLFIFFENQFNQGVLLFLLFIGLSIYKEIIFYKQREELYEYEEKDDMGGNTGFFRYLPLWIMMFFILFSGSVGFEISSVLLLIIFIIVSTTVQQLTEADERLRWNKFFKEIKN